jgi:sugar phosphate isomerase/epimerase
LIFVSTLAFDFPVGKYFKLNGKLPPIRQLELGAGFSPEEARLFCDQNQASADHDFLIHNYFPPPEDPFVLNLASNDPVIKDKSLRLCRRAIDFSAKVGAPFYSVHSGFAVDPAPEDLGKSIRHLPRFSLEKARDIFAENVGLLDDYAGKRGVRLLLENNVLAPQNAFNGENELLLMCDLEDFKRFDKDFKQDNVGILLDVGHLKISAAALGYDKYKAIEYSADRIEAFHLHDNNGLADQHSPFKADAWFLDILPQFRNQARFVLEMRNISIPEIEDQNRLLSENL